MAMSNIAMVGMAQVGIAMVKVREGLVSPALNPNPNPKRRDKHGKHTYGEYSHDRHRHYEYR